MTVYDFSVHVPTRLALGVPGPFEILLLMLMLGVPVVVVLVVLLRVKSRRREAPAFPIVPTAELDGPGKYRVVGVDQASRADRDVVVEAASRANAQVKAELDGIVVTSVARAS